MLEGNGLGDFIMRSFLQYLTVRLLNQDEMSLADGNVSSSSWRSVGPLKPLGETFLMDARGEERLNSQQRHSTASKNADFGVVITTTFSFHA